MSKHIIAIIILVVTTLSTLGKWSTGKSGRLELVYMMPFSRIERIDKFAFSPQFTMNVSAPFGKHTETVNGVYLDLVRVPQGSFLMGNADNNNSEEKPLHQVNLQSFYIGQYEFTRKQWNIVVDTLPKVSRDLGKQYIGPTFGGIFEETMPADIVFWDDALEICDRLTRLTGRKYRLPSEAEWEYACRASTRTEYSFGDEVDYSLAHFKKLGVPSFYLLPVGTKGYANPWGIYDMHGNVAEWCMDVKHFDYIGAPTDGSAWTQGGDQLRRSQRGGMYDFREELGRSSARLFWLRDVTASGFGFRVVAEITPTIGNGQITATSAASYTNINLASETIVALFGSNLSDVIQVASNTPLPISLAGASAFIKDSLGNEYAAPLFFVSPNQINLQIPAGIALGPATIYAVNNGNIHSSGSLEITNVSPGLFSADASGKGLAAAVALRVKANGEQVYEPVAQYDAASNKFVPVAIDVSNPAEQVFLLLFGTGFRHNSGLGNVRATVGGAAAEVLFAGAQGDFVGVDQCNLRLPNSLAGRGDVSIELLIDGKAANPVSIRIK